MLTSINQLSSQPKQEVRAVWLTTNLQLDWPPKSSDPEVQKKALIEILDDLSNKKFNTIYFQARSQGSVMYKSEIEPWSQYLTGALEGEPLYDPLKFILEEAHKRNFEVHAWVNMIRCKIGEQFPQNSLPQHVMLKQPEWVRKYIEGNSISFWLDPGLPEARNYLRNICIELITKYDVDGIHFDFIRYPGVNFDDSLSYTLYGNGMDLYSWRRENISKLVAEIYDTLIAIKPMLKVGSAPIGIYENILGARGWEGKNSVFQDSRDWLRREKQDYLTPQIYWDLENNPRFDVLLNDWMKNNFGRPIISGIGAYDNQVSREIDQQIETSRKLNASGQSFFRYENIKNNRFNYYKTLANIPPMKWKDSIPPNSPINLNGRNVPNYLGWIELVWESPPPAIDGDTVKFYNIYRSEDNIIDRNDSKYLTSFSSSYYLFDNLKRPKQLEYYYQVSSLDKGNNESIDASNIVKVELTNLKNILKPAYPTFLSYLSTKRIDGSIYFAVQFEKEEKIKIGLYDEKENLIQSVFQGNTTVGFNVFNFSTEKLKNQAVIIKVITTNRTEQIKILL